MKRNFLLTKVISFALILCALFALAAAFPAKPLTADAASTLQPTAADNLQVSLRSPSSLVATADGFMRVFYDGSQIGIEYYDDSFNLKSKKSVKMELPIWGGFYAGTDAYYMVEGQNNTAESDAAEVIRVIKYDTNWTKKGAAKITKSSDSFSAVRYPFDNGCVEMTEYNGKLYIVTAHEGYVDSAYNQGHQGFLLIEVDEASMTGKIVDCDLWHSFAQYIDHKDSNLYVLEQSEGSRYTKLTRYNANKISEKTAIPVLKYGGSHTSAWAIACYASVDGIALSSQNVLCLGTSIDQNAYDSVTADTPHNICLTVTPMSNFTEGATQKKWLTSYSGNGKCFLGAKITKVNDDRFMISWEEFESEQAANTSDALSGSVLHYMFVDGSGKQIGSTYTAAAPISGCRPIVKGSKIVYYASSSNMVDFYTIDAQTGSFTKKAYPIAGANAAWKFSGGTLTFSGSGALSIDSEPNYRTPVSSTRGGYSYISSDNAWAFIRDKVTKVVFKSGVTSIPDGAFKYFKNLTQVDIESGMKSIGKEAFAYNAVLDKITIPSSVTSIGDDILWTGYTWVVGGGHVVRATIYGYAGSKAESYAKANNIDFVELFDYATPKVSSVSNTTTGIKISWGKVTGATTYRLFYKTGSGGWTKIADTTSTSYTWTGAKSGTKYQITVRCMSADGKAYGSDYTEGKSITYIAAPKISSLERVANGLKVKWGKVTGAAKYRVFYKTGSGDWTKIADATSTSYTWTGAKNGTNYTIAVRCVSADGKSYTSNYYSAGMSIICRATPKLSSVSNTTTGVKLSWGKVSGAAKYRVFYKTGSGSWTKIADTTSTSYTWTGAKSGTKYTFTVRCMAEDGKSYASFYDETGKTKTYIAAPKVSSVSNTATGVKISWGKVTGAAKYRVFYKTSGGSWTQIADTTSTSYTWTGAKSGTKYSLTARCVSADGKSYAGSYTEGKSITYIAAPKISSLSNTETGLKISWGKVTGAEKYRIFYHVSDGWETIADTTSTSYTWTGAKSGTKYQITVRCVSADGKTYTSNFDSAGKTKTYIAAPKVSSVSNTATGVRISWGKVTGAAKYRVFYKTSGGDWTKIADTTSTSYAWTGAKSGTKYSLTVRCVSADGASYTGSYTSGESITYIAAPKISSLSRTSSGVKISWGKVTGAEKYRVFYRVTDGWETIADTTSTSYTWKGAQSGKSYTVTVRCVSADGKTYTSYYDSTGKTIGK